MRVSATPRSSRLFALLPLILLASMAVLGMVIEAVRYGTLLWATKIPLAALLTLGFFRRCTSSSSS